MHSHSFEQIWTKFSMWYSYSIYQMVMGRLASAACAPRLVLHAPSIYTTANGWQAALENLQLAGGPAMDLASTVGTRSNL